MSGKASISVIVTTHNRCDMVIRCARSILKSTLSPVEIIVVDNASTDDTVARLKKEFGSKIKIIESKNNLLAGGGRNLGAKSAKGTYLLFVDSDNIIHPSMIENLANSAKEYPRAGLLGPLMHYYSDKKVVWWAGADIDPLTSKTTYHGIGKVDTGQFKGVFEVGHIPNVFMIPKKIFTVIKGFDTKNFPMHYEESDLAERVKSAGYKVYCVAGALTFHDTPMAKDKKGKDSGFALNDRTRAYFNIRNRIVFMKKYGKNNLLFTLVFLPFFSLLYIFLLLKIGRPELIKHLLFGIKDGLLIQSK